MTVQLDMFAESEAAEKDALLDSAPSLYALPPCGLHARCEMYRQWCDTYGSFGSRAYKPHAWVPCFTAPDGYTEVCRPSLLDAALRCACDSQPGSRRDCLCVGGLVYRGACLHCVWEGEIRASENEAVEDAHDHAWPGWRDLPTVDRSPGRNPSARGQKTLRAWADKVNAVYPDGWLESGGPIRTERLGGMRHVPLATGFGGYDLSVRCES